MAHRLSRRTILRGLGVAIALPTLEAMTLPWRQAYAAVAARPPVRLLFIHTESGMWMPNYKPTKLGSGFELSQTLQPLAPFKSELSVLTGLFHENAFKRNPQAGRHAQDATCHLTGADLSGTPGVAVKNTISVDQLAAQHLGERTRVPVLNLSPSRGGSIAYTDSGSPVPALWSPPEIFSKLFADGSPEAKRQAEVRFRRNRSILDAVSEATRDLTGRLGANDRHKLDEYMTTVREVERRATVARKWADQPPVPPPTGVKPPPVAPEKNRTAHIHLLLDMLTLAFQSDLTRIATLQIGFMGCTYPELGLPDSYHGYTHHDNKPEKQAAMSKIDRVRIEHLAYFLGKLRAIKEGEHDLLYHSVIHYGGGMGSWHESTDLANFLVGRGGGALQPGSHTDYQQKPLANLYVRMLQAAGVPVTRFADSTGPLDAGV